MYWVCQLAFQMSMADVGTLLRVLRQIFPELPKDPQTQRRKTKRTMGSRKYFHLGLDKCMRRSVDKPSDPLNSVVIQIHVDGSSLSKPRDWTSIPGFQNWNLLWDIKAAECACLFRWPRSSAESNTCQTNTAPTSTNLRTRSVSKHYSGCTTKWHNKTDEISQWVLWRSWMYGSWLQCFQVCRLHR